MPAVGECRACSVAIARVIVNPGTGGKYEKVGPAVVRIIGCPEHTRVVSEAIARGYLVTEGPE